jgi:hypothetical protein
MTLYTSELVQRNATFAASGAFKGLPFPTNPALRVIGCVDSRVDPSDVLGLKLGEAESAWRGDPAGGLRLSSSSGRSESWYSRCSGSGRIAPHSV